MPAILFRPHAPVDADAAAGKLDALAEEALAEYRQGKAREF